MKFSNVIFAALLSIGLKANAFEPVEFVSEAEFDAQLPAEAGGGGEEPLPEGPTIEFGFEYFDDYQTLGPCGQQWVSSVYPGCWNKLEPGFSLHAAPLPGYPEDGNEEIMATSPGPGDGRPAIVHEDDVMLIKFKKYMWEVKFFVYVVGGNPNVPIWVEVFGKKSKNNPKELISLGKKEYRHGDFVGIIGKEIIKIMITAKDEEGLWVGDDLKEEIDTLFWMRFDFGGRVIYDPHFKTWGGKWFDYMGECDLVLLNAPNFSNDAALDIHIRTKVRYDYSYIESAVVRIGTETLEVASFGDYFLNGVANAELPNTINGYPITHRQLSVKEHVFTIQVEEGEEIVLKSFKDMVSVNVDADDERLHDSQGMMGEFGTGRMLSRDGTLLEDPNAFGAEWQVRDNEPKLFQTIEGPQYPETCKLPVVKKETRRLGENVALLKAAEEACAKWHVDAREACIHDVVATGDLDLADAGAF